MISQWSPNPSTVAAKSVVPGPPSPGGLDEKV